MNIYLFSSQKHKIYAKRRLRPWTFVGFGLESSFTVVVVVVVGSGVVVDGIVGSSLGFDGTVETSEVVVSSLWWFFSANCRFKSAFIAAKILNSLKYRIYPKNLNFFIKTYLMSMLIQWMQTRIRSRTMRVCYFQSKLKITKMLKINKISLNY